MKWLREWFREILIVLGIGLIGYGCYLIWLPLAPLTVGSLFLFFAILPYFLRGD